MPIPIKIQCGCGQAYEFEVEPVDGQMPGPVACPTCGMDGTAASNDVIAQSFAAPPPEPEPAPVPAPAPARAGGLRISHSAHAASSEAAPQQAAPRRPVRLPGQLDREQAETEARAKVSWGDAPEQVLSFLMIQGFTREEASAFIDELYAERAVEVRKRGFVNIVVGSLMFLVPVVLGIICFRIGVMPPMFLLALAVIVGIGGFILVVRGIFMVVAPRSQKGDVAEQ